MNGNERIMKLAIQEDMLVGATALHRFQEARRLGLDGVEVWGPGLTERVPELVAASAATGLPIAAVCHGRQSRLIDPDRAERERALAELRQSICNAVDLGASGVILVPHFGPPTVPDFTPYKGVLQLEYELLHNHLRSLSDYVYAMGVDLYIEPVNRYVSHFITTLADGVRARRRTKDHPHVKLCADCFHAALGDYPFPACLKDYAPDIGYLHLADSNRRLPGQGLIDFTATLGALQAGGYDGWASLECGSPSENAEFAAQYQPDLPEAIALLRRAGF
jgi:sugar phosphate isomerase/epimerase